MEDRLSKFQESKCFQKWKSIYFVLRKFLEYKKHDLIKKIFKIIANNENALVEKGKVHYKKKIKNVIYSRLITHCYYSKVIVRKFGILIRN